jgi:hypothetical protein
MTKKFEVNDRVKRATGTGCLGTVKDVRSDITVTSQEAREKGILLNVQWDNGTLSYLSPDVLENAQGGKGK